MTYILILQAVLILHMLAFGLTVRFVDDKQRKGRMPMGKDFKLLRSPGEYLQERIAALSDKLGEEILNGFMVPVVIALVPLSLFGLIPAGAKIWVGMLVVAAFIISFVIRVRRVLALIRERRDYRLGLLGERAVAERLAVLSGRGMHVLHDLPAVGSSKAFNLDHVVIGPAGVFVIETKTRRKPNAKKKEDDHKVFHDGRVITWPNGRDEDTVPQVVNSAKWLREFISSRLAIQVDPVPVVAIPGWWVERTVGKTSGDTVLILNDKQLLTQIKGPSVMNEREVDLIWRRLQDECRTVAFEG